MVSPQTRVLSGEILTVFDVYGIAPDKGVKWCNTDCSLPLWYRRRQECSLVRYWLFLTFVVSLQTRVLRGEILALPYLYCVSPDKGVTW